MGLAHGKIILFGEHAVVYGRRALAVGIPDGFVLDSLTPTSGAVRLRIPSWNLDETDDSKGLIGDVLRRLLKIVSGNGQGCDVRLAPSLPAGAGFGSSAALSVALVRSLSRARGTEVGNEEVRLLAHELEEVFHGRPSGLDDTVAAHGGLCLFRRTGWEAEPGYPFIGQALSAQAFRITCRMPALIVGNSGVVRATREMIALVRRQWEEDRDRVESLFDEIDRCLEDGLIALSRSEWKILGLAMLRNHQALKELGLSCPEIEEMIRLASDAGADGAKLTGAGGGGGVIALAVGREDKIARIWRAHGFSALKSAFPANASPKSGSAQGRFAGVWRL